MLPLRSNDDINKATLYITKIIQMGTWSCTPTRIVSTYQNQNYSLDIKKKILEKRRLHKNWQLSRLSKDKLALNKAAMKLRALLNKIDNDTLTRKLESLSPSNSNEYSLENCYKNTRIPPMINIPILKFNDNKWARSEAEKAEVFVQFLQKVFTPQKIVKRQQ